MDVWRAMIRAQDGDPDAVLPAPRESHTVVSTAAGVVTRMDALPFGIAAWRLGAGRARAEDAVIHSAGIDLHVKPGDRVAAGQPVFTLVGDDASRFDRALEAVAGAWDIGASAPERGPLVFERITA
jgi:thymidine phosphorylase